MVEELIKSNKEDIVNIFALKSWIEENTNMIESIKEKVFEIDERELKKISSLTTPNNVLAISHCKKEESCCL
jgi:tRNA G18 (ribose-2'-O)-methylase SpoU